MASTILRLCRTILDWPPAAPGRAVKPGTGQRIQEREHAAARRRLLEQARRNTAEYRYPRRTS
ncbi:hypothetical protein AB0873_09490 [Micromonospora sp. NPDC047707]|uniref:hypothetical protein n=1 Tax=Micromonospora sp. NPDC047707 TaxID=3154498 RepID=UPI0034557F82